MFAPTSNMRGCISCHEQSWTIKKRDASQHGGNERGNEREKEVRKNTLNEMKMLSWSERKTYELWEKEILLSGEKKIIKDIRYIWQEDKAVWNMKTKSRKGQDWIFLMKKQIGTLWRKFFVGLHKTSDEEMRLHENQTFHQIFSNTF